MRRLPCIFVLFFASAKYPSSKNKKNKYNVEDIKNQAFSGDKQ